MGDADKQVQTVTLEATGAGLAPDAAPALDLSNVQLGPFLLESRCGHGAMGVVYAARDLRDGHPVAVKVLPARLLADFGRARRFIAEAEVLASLDHPAIVHYVAHGQSPAGEPFLAMDWLEGEDLARRLQRRRLALREVTALGRRVAEGLSAAHARGVVHRDIKPSNLFLRGGDPEQVVILDFGIARADHASPSLTGAGAVIGTPGYMAPEQARGALAIDARADLFSLGAVLFECLAGRPAFGGDHVMAVLAKVLLETPPRLVALRADVPPALDELVARMLAKDPAARPESAAAVAAALARMSFPDGDVEIAVTLPHAGVVSSLTNREQRFLCVVVAGTHRASEGSPVPASAVTVSTTLSEALLEALQRAAAPLGAEVVCLLDGTVLATLRRAGSAADEAVQAARCALALRPLLPGVPLAVVVGLGDAAAPVPVGQVLERAAALVRMPGREAGSGAWIDDVTAGLLDARFVVRGGPGVREVLQERSAGTGARLLLGRPSPCVGRERELRLLGELLDECVTEQVARSVLVKAPAGVGKSRLLHELVDAALRRGDGTSIWCGRGDPLSAGSAFALLAAALRDATGVREGEAIEVRRHKLAERVARHVAEKDRARVAAFLGELTATPFPDDELPLLRMARVDAIVLGEQVSRAFADFVAAECSAHPVLLVLEDLQWGDLPSVKLVDRALAKLRDRPLLVVAVGRPQIDELFPRLWAERGAQELRLGELGRRAAERLVRHALGESASAATVERIVERAAGNAFYLEELIRAVAEGRDQDLPETVLAMVHARLDALGPEERRILRAGSVFGETFWRGGVLSLLGGGAEQAARIGEQLATLVDREVLTRRDESRFPGEDELAFRHALLREGAHAMLTEHDRTMGHRLAGAWLEERGESDPMVLAEHFERGGEAARAAVHYFRAAQQAFSGNDPRAAVARSTRGLACDAGGVLGLRLRELLGRARAYTGDLAGAEVVWNELVPLAPQDGQVFCAVLLFKLVLARQRGRPEMLVEVMSALPEILPSADNLVSLLEIRWVAGLALRAADLHALANRNTEEAEQTARLASPRDLAVQGYVAGMRGEAALHVEGDLLKAARLNEHAAVCLEAVGLTWRVQFVRVLAGAAHALLGAYERSEEHLRQVLATAGTAMFAGWYARVLLVWTLVGRGALEEAEQAAREIRSDADPAREGWSRATLAHALRHRGDLDGAAREAELSLPLPPLMPLQRAGTLATLAAVRLAQGRAAEALAAAREAMGTEEPPPVRSMFEPMVRRIHVEALLAAGEHDAARAALILARDRLLAAAAKIDDPELCRAFLEDVADNARTLQLAEERLGPA